MPEQLRLRRYTRNQDDHCVLTFNGINWRIIGMRGLGWIILRDLDNPENLSALDLSNADLSAYAARAAAWLQHDLEISNADLA